MQAIRSGKQRLVLQELDLREIFNEVEFNLSEMAVSKNIKIVFRLDPKNIDGKLRVLAEPTSLVHDVLSNFISNAIKFSNKNSLIEVSAFSEHDSVHIIVKDEGVGIPDDMVDLVFQSHSETSRPGTNNEKGTGFGMPLAKYFIEQYGGVVSITSHVAENDDDHHGTEVHTVLKKVS